MEQTYAIGIDIGGTNTDIGLVRSDGTCIARTNLPTQSYSDIEAYADDVADAIRKILSDNGIKEIVGVGIGAPNGNYYTGTIDYAPNLPFKGRIFLQELIRSRLDTKVVLTNDANAAAFGEKIYGGARGLTDFILITLGTGVGSGIFVNGQMVYGHDGFAGELGHAILYPDGRACSCGRSGCLEAYASARGIVQTYKELCQENGIAAPADITCRDITQRADSGDELAIDTWRRTALCLGIALSNAVTFSSPQAIFLMGGPVKAGHWLLDPLKQYFDEYLLTIFKGKADIRRSELPENDAAVLGAAALVYE